VYAPLSLPLDRERQVREFGPLWDAPAGGCCAVRAWLSLADGNYSITQQKRFLGKLDKPQRCVVSSWHLLVCNS
jgi:hypothetical protein